LGNTGGKQIGTRWVELSGGGGGLGEKSQAKIKTKENLLEDRQIIKIHSESGNAKHPDAMEDKAEKGETQPARNS